MKSGRQSESVVRLRRDTRRRLKDTASENPEEVSITSAIILQSGGVNAMALNAVLDQHSCPLVHCS